MRIDKLDIRGFGKIHNLIIEFSKGLIWFTVKTRPGKQRFNGLSAACCIL